MRHATSRLIATTLLLAAGTAQATITGGATSIGGGFQKLTVPLPNPFGPPDSVGDDNFQSPKLLGFDESQNIVLAAPLLVDAVPGGSTTLAVGSTVASHYIFFDPLQDAEVDGIVNFDSKIVVLIFSSALLAGSDFLASTGVNYLNPTARGLEPGDSVGITGPNQIRFHTFASTPGDYVRVLTEFSPGAVPEPGTWAMFVLGGAALSLAAARRPRAGAAR
jgi:hypothetical protein